MSTSNLTLRRIGERHWLTPSSGCPLAAGTPPQAAHGGVGHGERRADGHEFFFLRVDDKARYVNYMLETIPISLLMLYRHGSARSCVGPGTARPYGA
jgi:hypothetical protein